MGLQSGGVELRGLGKLIKTIETYIFLFMGILPYFKAVVFACLLEFLSPLGFTWR